MRIFDKTILTEKIRESLASILPVTAIVLLLIVTVVPVPTDMLMAFVVGALMMIVGMGLFTLGAEGAMSPIGSYIGAKITKTRSLKFIVLVAFLVGVLITVSEPDLQVLATQITSIPSLLLITAVGIGVGLFLVVAMLRIIFRIKLKYLLIVFYLMLFVLAIFVPENFLPLAFDSGGVTTGPMTVPFILALGVGVSSIRSDSKADDDSFGLVALCSIGPIFAVMLLAIIFPGDAEALTDYAFPDVDNSRELLGLFGEEIPSMLWEMAIALLPIFIFFLVFRLLFGGMGKNTLHKIIVGIIYTYFGLVLFLAGVNVGFMPVGNYLGFALADSKFSFVIVPLGMIIGYFIVSAEPAVQVLKKQVEQVTSGAIPGKLLGASLSIGVAVSIGIAMLRVLTGISIMYFLIPGYLVALLLSFVVPDIFTSIAFDSGGVASGPMTATFLLPFAVGACTAVGGNVVESAFGVVAYVAMTPLITIQILGLIYKYRQAHSPSVPESETFETEILSSSDASRTVEDDDIIEL